MTLRLGARRFVAAETNAFVAEVALPLPVFNRNQGALAEASARADKARAERRTAAVGAEAALAETYEDLVAAYEHARRLADTVVPRAEAAVAGTRQAHAQGMVRSLDVLEAQRTVATVEEDHLEALARYQTAAADLERRRASPSVVESDDERARSMLVVLALLAGCRDGAAERAAIAPPGATHEDVTTDHAYHDAETPFRVADFEHRGVRLATAAAGSVDVGVDLPGEVRPNGDRLAHLAPRFPGLVREVRKRAGDSVRAGEVLAIVESETLARFELTAAFDGVVVDRHVAPGEAVGRDTPAFIVADLATVWVDVHVYQAALAELRIGQAVRVTAPTGGPEAEGQVSYIAPVVDQGTRTASARVVLDNADGRWRPGLFVTVTILNATNAALVVPRTAVHDFAGDTVVFVVEGDRFVPRRVTLGRTGKTRAEITSGLAPAIVSPTPGPSW